MKATSNAKWILPLWCFAAAMQGVWGISGRGMSLWPIWTVLYVIIGIRSAPRSPVDGLKVVQLQGSFLTSPGTRIVLAVLVATADEHR